MVVEIWLVGSGALPSRTTTFGGGAGAGGVGFVPFVATVGVAVELLAGGTPAEGFFAIRLFGFGAGAGGGVVVVVVSVVAGAAGGVAGCSGAGVSIVGACACGGGTGGLFFLQPDTDSMAAASEAMTTSDRMRAVIC